MSLYEQPLQPESDAEHLGTEARKLITQWADTTLWTLTQLLNYQHNNGKGVTPDEIKKAIGDVKGFDSAFGYMKRALTHVNPDFKTKLAELNKQFALNKKQIAKLAPKKTKKATQ